MEPGYAAIRASRGHRVGGNDLQNTPINSEPHLQKLQTIPPRPAVPGPAMSSTLGLVELSLGQLLAVFWRSLGFPVTPT